MSKGQHAMRFVAQKTGLSPHVIRVWERRYAVVAPNRSGTNRRLYTDVELERLVLLAQACRCGHNIGNIARLPDDRLRLLAADCLQAKSQGVQPSEFITSALAAAKALDAPGLEAVLVRGAVAFGHQGLLCRVVAPLVLALGAAWHAGEITAAQEHFSTAVIRGFLGQMRPYAPSDAAPLLVVATLTGQLHELGALLVAAAATSLGWRVTYLGVGLPALEIAGAVHQASARAVALSLVYPDDDPHLPGEVLRLRAALPPVMPLLIGGRAAASYRPALGDAQATFIGSLDELFTALDAIRAAR
jgi:MerR family transcriptional regulator, light-induced transcriptional regulator